MQPAKLLDALINRERFVIQSTESIDEPLVPIMDRPLVFNASLRIIHINNVWVLFGNFIVRYFSDSMCEGNVCCFVRSSSSNEDEV